MSVLGHRSTKYPQFITKYHLKSGFEGKLTTHRCQNGVGCQTGEWYCLGRQFTHFIESDDHLFSIKPGSI